MSTARFATEQIHAGDLVDAGYGARIPPVHLTAGFRFQDFEEARARFAGEDDGYSYTRIGNPSIAALERRLAHLERGDESIVVGSGQAAVSVALLALLRAGDHLVAAGHLYEGSRNLFQENFARFGIEVDFVDDSTSAEAWTRLIRPTTRALFGESIANPTNEVLDIALVAEVAHAHGLPLVVDNTLATPYLLRPVEHGADVVVHSASKFLAGHGACLGGAVVVATTVDRHATGTGDRGYADFARHVIGARLGPTLSPMNAFLIQQGIETLSLRMRQHSANALVVAQWLERRPEVVSVDYAALPWHASYPAARRYLPRGAGAVLAFTVAGGEPAARTIVEGVTVFSHMTHIGDVRSLILHPASTTHALRPRAEREAAGIGAGTLRLSVGIEDADDLVADLDGAFRRLRPTTSPTDTVPARGAVPAPDAMPSPATVPAPARVAPVPVA
jgi:O-acetylhomoserine (thiol)-lyase